MRYGCPKTLLVAATLLLAAGNGIAQTPAEIAQQEVEAALKLTPNPDNGREVFKVCAICHLPEGWGTQDGYYPQIAGQLQSVIIKQLADIRARNRDNPTMRPFTAPRLLGGPQEIADVAAYISQLPMNPENGVGSGDDLEFGKKLFRENCEDCHGESGDGNAKKHIPSIRGQHFGYLTRQFEWIRSGRRRNADQEMEKQINRFTKREEYAVLDYVSRLGPAPKKRAPVDWLNPDFPNYSRDYPPPMAWDLPLAPGETAQPRNPAQP